MLFKPCDACNYMIVVLKLGGVLFSDKNSDQPRIYEDVLARIAAEVADAYERLREEGKRLVVIHGAGSFGNPIIKKHRLENGTKNRLDIYPVCRASPYFALVCGIVTRFLNEAGVPAYPFQPSTVVEMWNRRISSAYLHVLEKLISLGIVPVIGGMPTYDRRLGFSILKGEEIAAYLARILDVDRLVFATDVDGVYTADPKVNRNADFVPEIRSAEEVKEYLSGGHGVDVTGGMRSMVETVLGIPAPVYIVNGLVPGRIKKALLGERVKGTLIRPAL